MRADRLVNLVLLLQAHGRMPAAALAAELRVSVRTVYRDLAALSVSGVPVVTESGPGGGCRLLDGYSFPLRGLTSDEAAALLLPGVPAALAELGLAGPLASARRKISVTSGAPAGPALVHLDMPRWFAAKEDVPHLRTVAVALRDRRRLRIRYRDGQIPRVLDPLGLVNKAGLWYLVAARPGGGTGGTSRTGGTGVGTGDPSDGSGGTGGQRPAVFRAGRITSASVLTEAAVRDEGFDLAAFWALWSAEFEASLPSCEVRVRASPAALGAFAEIFGDGAHAILEAAGPSDGEGFREVTLTFEHELAAAHRLAGFGGHIEVLSPATVRATVIDTARETLERYRCRSRLGTSGSGSERDGAPLRPAPAPHRALMPASTRDSRPGSVTRPRWAATRTSIRPSCTRSSSRTRTTPSGMPMAAVRSATATGISHMFRIRARSGVKAPFPTGRRVRPMRSIRSKRMLVRCLVRPPVSV